MGGQKNVDALSFLRNEKDTNTLVIKKLDDLIKLFILEVNKKTSKIARTAVRYILIYTPTNLLQNASYEA